ncbi:cytochrome-c peroxidase [Granulosicoccus sp.]|nr:cytochrome c peroxidase [Granulosicoccus sp.]MDB4223284.1 cytochrome-c peroxidase [Granulosicoccus sp.]
MPQPLSADDFPEQEAKQVKLGQLLFYDKILSGNKNISCGTCHHHTHFGTDGLSLGIGEGGTGIGPDRLPGKGDTRIKRRIPRNAPALWNLGSDQIEVLFHDGRLTRSDDYGVEFNSPAEERLPTGLSGLLAAQAMFPVTSRFEMAGDPEENSVARASFDRIDHVWPILTKRIQNIPEYETLFSDAFVHINKGADITFVDVANALAAFQGTEWQSYDSPFDAYLAGDDTALNDGQLRGMELFYGDAGCATCHSGNLLSDQSFHALGLPTFGPGRTRLFDPIPRDTGRLGETDLVEDSYRFRTPSLRNVELTAPYGHNGAYASLAKMIEHHLNPVESRESWRRSYASLPDVAWLNHTDMIITADVREMARYAERLDVEAGVFNDSDVSDLVKFMGALTGQTARDGRLGVPERVPSGLEVDQ